VSLCLSPGGIIHPAIVAVTEDRYVLYKWVPAPSLGNWLGYGSRPVPRACVDYILARFQRYTLLADAKKDSQRNGAEG
jgi:hypothetical protein